MSDTQLNIDFTSVPSFARTDFILGTCNALAADWIDRWPDWPGRIKGIVLEGPEASGKSHLATIWQKLSGAYIMTSLDEAGLANLENTPNLIWDHPCPGADWPDDLLFHHLNTLTEIGGSVLVTSRMPMTAFEWSLADNNSRMRGLVSAAITAPDDDVLHSLLFKHADDLGLLLESEVAHYIVSRADRSFLAVDQMVKTLNNACLSGQRKLTIPMVRQILSDDRGEKKTTS